MTPSRLRAKIIAERAAWVRRMLAGIRALPLETFASFQADPRNAAAAESHLRRALEAMLDLGRHVLAKGFGRAVTEYEDVARTLIEVGVLDERQGTVIRSGELADVEAVLPAILGWIEANPEKVDQSL